MPYDFALSSTVLSNGRTVHYAKLNGATNYQARITTVRNTINA